MAISGVGGTAQIDGHTYEVESWSVSDGYDLTGNALIDFCTRARDWYQAEVQFVFDVSIIPKLKRNYRRSKRHHHPRVEHRRQCKIKRGVSK
jgi:hypothetical protein